MIEVLKQMVEALEWCHGGEPVGTAEAIQAGKQAIAELEQRTWVGLTDDEMLMIYGQQHEGKKYSLGRMVQQALKEKNT